jgi:NAD(P)H-hydrate epimerase
LKVEINEPTPTLTEIQVADKRAPGKTLFIVDTTHNEWAAHTMIQSFVQTQGKGTLIVAAPSNLAPLPAATGKILTFFPQEQTRTGSLALKNKAGLLELAHHADQVVLRMDPSTDSGTQQLCRELITEIDRPLVINGPATATACEHQGLAQNREAETVLIIDQQSLKEVANHVFRDIRDDRVRGLQRLCRKCDAILVLEGERPLIGYPDERVFIDIHTNPGIALESAEALLTGVLTALTTWGLSLRDAVRQGVGLRGLSIDLAIRDLSRGTIKPKMILNYVPLALKKSKATLPDPSEGDSTKIPVT